MHQGQATSFGALLRRYRVAAGLTQEELAERAGLSVRTVSDLERGVNRSPRKDTLPLLAAALGLTSEERRHLEAASRQPDAAPSFSRNVAVPSAPPLVGRTKELALLERHLAGEGPPVLLLAGEPGIGKTRLLQAAMDRARDRGWRALDGGCQRRGGQEPYAPLLGALQRYLRGRSPVQARGELQGCAWLVRLLPELAGGPIEPLPAWSLAPEHEHRLMTAAAVRFLANVAGPSGTLLVLDDLQWAGPEALELLATLVRTAEAPLRVVGAYRDSEVGASDPLSALLADLAHAGQVARRLVAPLLHDEATELLAALLPDGTQPTPRDEILRRAAGVPFFLMSWAQAVVQGEQTANEAALPWTVAQSVRQRVAALHATVREVLGVAAVMGREVPRPLLVAVAAHPERVVVEALGAACSARLLEEAGAHTYRFVHDVIREVIEADLGVGRRALLHRDIAAALEAAPGDPPVDALAHHYAGAAEHGKAAYWLERAGDQAAASFANAAALERYTAAREHFRAARAEAEALTRLEEKLGDLRVLMGAYAQAQEDFARARAASRDAARRAELWRKEGVAWHLLGEFERALSAFASAADGDGMELPVGVRVAVELSRGETLWRWGHYDAAQEVAERALALLNVEAPGTATDRALARAHHLQGRILWVKGNTAQAEGCHRRSLAIYEHLGDQQGCANVWIDLGWEAYQRGDLPRAEECCRSSLAIAERIGDHYGMSRACNFLSTFALNRGNFGAAEEYACRVLSISESSGNQRETAVGCKDLGRVLLERGNLAQAEECFRRAVAILERSPYQGGIGGSALPLNLLGTLALQRGALAEAEGWFQRSLNITEQAESSGHPGPISYAWHGLGELAAERGDLSAAAAWYRRARRLARRCGAPDIEALAAIGLVHIRLRNRPTEPRRPAVMALAKRACAVATRHGFSLAIVRAALLEADVHVHCGSPAEAWTKAEEALQLATTVGRKREEALARCLLGQCALALGTHAEAVLCLRAALAILTDMGAALEAARTRVVLAQALAAQAGHGLVPDEARALLAEATDQCAISGATLDLAQAEQLSALWRDR